MSSELNRRLKKLEESIPDNETVCVEGVCDSRSWRMRGADLEEVDKETGLKIHVCSADRKLWLEVKGTEFPNTLREYEAFKTAHHSARVKAHVGLKPWRMGNPV